MTIKIKDTTITIDGNKLLTSRFISNRLHKVVLDLDGSIGDFGIKAKRVSELDDQLYIEFSEITKSVI